MRKIIIIISTFFYSGYSKIAPGTMGTIAFLPFYYFLFSKMDRWLYLSITIFLYFLGVWASNYAIVIFKDKDPSKVVIDEVVGFLVTMMFIPFSIKRMVVGFFIARILDIIKIPPARQSEKLYAGNGVMMDDLISGIYGNILMWILIYFKII